MSSGQRLAGGSISDEGKDMNAHFNIGNLHRRLFGPSITPECRIPNKRDARKPQFDVLCKRTTETCVERKRANEGDASNVYGKDSSSFMSNP